MRRESLCGASFLIGDDLAKGRGDHDRGGDCSQLEIELASTARQIGDHEHGHNAENPRPDSIHYLDGHE